MVTKCRHCKNKIDYLPELVGGRKAPPSSGWCICNITKERMSLLREINCLEFKEED